MSNWLVIAVTCAYAWTGIELGFKGQAGFSVMFIGYAIANCGLLWAMNNGTSQ